MKQLIINADDFGMSEEINEGIKRGIEAGIITSVSMMVNMPYFDDAVKYLKKHPEVSVGLHFDITEGMPVTIRKNVSTLIREDGTFFYWTAFILMMILNKISNIEIENELMAQYKILKRTRLKISHIDSHHHIHLLPGIFKMIMDFAQKNDVKALRCRAFNPNRLLFWLTHPPTLKQFIIIALCVIDSSLFRKYKYFYEINNLYDIGWDKKLNEDSFCEYLRSLPSGTTEIICHPAILSKTGNPKFLGPRYKALSLLLSKKVFNTIKQSHFKLVGRV
jgi:chitin disaccharide deacetylase